MIEPITYFGVGFFVAALLGLLLVPRLHNRAVRQTMRRLNAATPNAGGRDSGTVDIFRADIRQLEGQLAVALEERSKLLCEIAAALLPSQTSDEAASFNVGISGLNVGFGYSRACSHVSRSLKVPIWYRGAKKVVSYIKLSSPFTMRLRSIRSAQTSCSAAIVSTKSSHVAKSGNANAPGSSLR